MQFFERQGELFCMLPFTLTRWGSMMVRKFILGAVIPGPGILGWVGGGGKVGRWFGATTAWMGDWSAATISSRAGKPIAN